ncbi:(d)CMP kinase [Heliorestis acidaminivorans]|uniref:Cytidylate kinase n=1 Tax=Heliorestis acidaminivorans TaxID=553427 RepID=A0A6I0F732_9FIRM|nr:(d)CMP kinase [Heliorestis acidaminivorans]KAB2954627.1 (d)CMP kinase [Heliorestis acidaminivorans]
MIEPIQIAIDGPAGAGKSTVAKEVARRLGYLYIDTGAMYRALTCLALEKNVSLFDEQALTNLAHNSTINLVQKEERLHVFVENIEVTEAIRSPLVSSHVSQVAAVAGVRMIMVEQQRAMARSQSVVMDGRDIGSHVLPFAQIKIFLTASIEERARRRYLEMTAKGIPVNEEVLKEEIQRRDEQDASREVSPLVRAEDASILDTTGLEIEAVIQIILDLTARRGR